MLSIICLPETAERERDESDDEGAQEEDRFSADMNDGYPEGP